MEEKYNYASFGEFRLTHPYKPGADPFPGPHIGAPAPDFSAKELDEMRTISLSEFRNKKNVVIMFGSMTSPPAVKAVSYASPTLDELQSEFGTRGFEFFIIYTREAHPSEKIPMHTSFEQKRNHARMFRSEHHISVPILPDTLEGDIDRAYGSKANMVYVINRQGIVTYRCNWTNTVELRSVLDNVLEWEIALSQPQPHPYIPTYYVEHMKFVKPQDWVSDEVKEKVLNRSGGEKAVESWKKVLPDPF